MKKQLLPLNYLIDLNDKFGYFEFNDAQGDVSREFSNHSIQIYEIVKDAAPKLLLEYKTLLTRLKDASDFCLKGGSQVAEELAHEFSDFESPAIKEIEEKIKQLLL